MIDFIDSFSHPWADAVISASLFGGAQAGDRLARDRGQQVFRQSFEEFSGRMISPERMRKGANMLKQYAGTFVRIQEQFGVPGPVLVAIWGLETDFGTNVGKYPTIRSLATLAYDCRRSDKFSAELMEALRIVDRGDLIAADIVITPERQKYYAFTVPIMKNVTHIIVTGPQLAKATSLEDLGETDIYVSQLSGLYDDLLRISEERAKAGKARGLR